MRRVSNPSQPPLRRWIATACTQVARAALLTISALGFTANTAHAVTPPLVKVNDSLYYTEHCVFIIVPSSQATWNLYSSVYSSPNLASYYATLNAQFPNTYFSICYAANQLTPNSVPIYTDQIYKASGIVQPGTPGAPQSSSTVDYCRYNLGGGTVITGALSVYDHELGHAWGARIFSVPGHWVSNSTIDCQMSATYTDDGGTTVKKIYGDPTQGFRWRAMNSLHSNDTELYSDQELYLMGVEPTLPTYYELASPVYNADHTISHSGSTTYDHAGVVAAHGARNPDFRAAQKQFRLAFVYLARDLAEVNNVYSPFEQSAEHFCNAESVDTSRFRFQVPFLVATKYRASVVARLADLDGNTTPTLTLGATHVTSSNGSATINFTAADADGAAPTVSLVTTSTQATVGASSVSFTGLPDGAHFFTLKAADAGGKKAFAHFVVEVQRAASSTSVSSQPAGQTALAGTTASFSVTANGTPASFTYQWYRQPAGTSTWNLLSNGGAYSGATGATLSVQASTAMQGDRFLCIVDNGTGTATSASAELTVNELAPPIATQPTNQLIASGSAAHFTTVVTGAPSTFGYFTYVWEKLAAAGGGWTTVTDGSGYTGATTGSLTISGSVTTTAMSGDQYRCTVTNTAGTTVSSTATLTVEVRPTISIHPSSVTAAAGGSASMSVTASGSPTLAYQWYRYGVAVSGATSATISWSNLQSSDAGAYTVTVTNNVGSASSNVGSLTVTGITAPSITTGASDQSLSAGQAATFSIAASGTSPTYQWARSTNGGSSWSNLFNDSTYSGVTTTTLTVSGTTTGMSGDKFRCTATNSGGSAISNSATLTVAALIVAPSITTPPANSMVTAGSGASFTVAATGTATLSPQWQRSINSGSSWSSLSNDSTYSGVTTATLSITGTTLGMSGDQFRCVVTNSAGSATSAAATLTVNAAPVAPGISTPPADLTVTAGHSANFTVVATGTATLSYQWKHDGVAISGATNATLTLPSTQSSDAGAYTVTVTNTVGSATSTAATLTVNPAPVPPAITSAPQSLTVASGASASFSVSVSGTAPFTYQWRRDGSPLSGATSSTLTLSAAQTSEAGAYSVVVSNVAGSVISTDATLTVTTTTTPEPPPTTPPTPAPSTLRLIGISTRSLVGTGGDIQIGGFAITGTAPKKVVIRASGPALADFGLPGTLADPVLTLFTGQTQLDQNDNWDAANAAEFTRLGMFAWQNGSKDAALVLTLAPGAYTAQVSGAGGGTGVALIEIYDGDDATNPSRITGISTRSLVGGGGDIQIGGFAIEGTSPKKVVIRASGPALADFGLPGALVDPVLQLYSGQTVIASSDDWSASLASEFSALGMFPWTNGSRDAALVLTLDPGRYTAQIAGKNGGTGVALIEIYEVP